MSTCQTHVGRYQGAAAEKCCLSFKNLSSPLKHAEGKIQLKPIGLSAINSCFLFSPWSYSIASFFHLRKWFHTPWIASCNIQSFQLCQLWCCMCIHSLYNNSQHGLDLHCHRPRGFMSVANTKCCTMKPSTRTYHGVPQFAALSNSRGTKTTQSR